MSLSLESVAALDAFMMVNGNDHMHIDIRDPYETGSTSGIVYLTAGDAVPVEVAPNNSVLCTTTGDCNFSGYLLHETLL